MKLEHFALNVADPRAMAEWWVKNLGFDVSFEGPAPECCRFIRDSSKTIALELYHNPSDKPAPDYASMNPLNLHIAFVSEDVDADVARLVAAGAVKLERVSKPGLELAMLREPSAGIAIQLAKRVTPVID